MKPVVPTIPQRMDRWAGKVAIVTGASSGIGAAISRALLDHGLKVVGLARRLDRLKELGTKSGKGKFYPIQCDLSKEEDILKAFQWVEKELGGVDVLVNNAGTVVPGPITESSTESFRKVMDVNVIATAICAREAVRSMKKRKASGHILNMNSVAGHFAESIELSIGLYPASKYAVTAMSMALRHEMNAAKLDIRVTSISPGAVKTEILSDVGLPAEIIDAMPKLEAKDIADAVIYALSTPSTVQVCEVIVTPNEGLSGTGDPAPWKNTSSSNM